MKCPSPPLSHSNLPSNPNQVINEGPVSDNQKAPVLPDNSSSPLSYSNNSSKVYVKESMSPPLNGTSVSSSNTPPGSEGSPAAIYGTPTTLSQEHSNVSPPSSIMEHHASTAAAYGSGFPWHGPIADFQVQRSSPMGYANYKNANQGYTPYAPYYPNMDYFSPSHHHQFGVGHHQMANAYAISSATHSHAQHQFSSPKAANEYMDSYGMGVGVPGMTDKYQIL